MAKNSKGFNRKLRTREVVGIDEPEDAAPDPDPVNATEIADEIAASERRVTVRTKKCGTFVIDSPRGKWNEWGGQIRDDGHVLKFGTDMFCQLDHDDPTLKALKEILDGKRGPKEKLRAERNGIGIVEPDELKAPFGAWDELKGEVVVDDLFRLRIIRPDDEHAIKRALQYEVQKQNRTVVVSKLQLRLAELTGTKEAPVEVTQDL